MASFGLLHEDEGISGLTETNLWGKGQQSFRFCLVFFILELPLDHELGRARENIDELGCRRLGRSRKAHHSSSPFPAGATPLGGGRGALAVALRGGWGKNGAGFNCLATVFPGPLHVSPLLAVVRMFGCHVGPHSPFTLLLYVGYLIFKVDVRSILERFSELFISLDHGPRVCKGSVLGKTYGADLDYLTVKVALRAQCQ